VTFRCRGREPYSCFLKKNGKKKEKQKILLLVVVGSSVLYLTGFDPLKLDY